MARLKLINSKTIFISTCIVVFTMILLVYISGIHNHRSFYLNSLISTSILSVIFLLFIFAGLYNGWKLKDTLGNLLDKINLWKIPASPTMNVSELDADIIGGDGIEGCLISVAVWIIVGLFGSLILWLLGAVLWGVVLAVAAILYWIIFRAFRLIFSNSSRCKGNLFKSLSTALLFTFLYNCWIYAIIIGAHYLQQR